MRGGGFLIAAFVFGIMAAASQANVAPPTHTTRAAELAAPLPDKADDMSLLFYKEPPATVPSEPTAAIVKPVAAPHRKPAPSADEQRRLKRLRMFELDNAADEQVVPSFRAGPRNTVLLQRN